MYEDSVNMDNEKENTDNNHDNSVNPVVGNDDNDDDDDALHLIFSHGQSSLFLFRLMV